jgi:hypothetical protein
MKRTKSEIKAQIDFLGKDKMRVTKYSAFGEDNHAAIDAQINVLTNSMTEDNVCVNYRYIGEDDFNGRYIFEAAIETALWLSGERNEDPHLDWSHLTKKIDQQCRQSFIQSGFVKNGHFPNSNDPVWLSWEKAWKKAAAGEREACACIALAIDSGLGNEKEIAKAIRDRSHHKLT